MKMLNKKALSLVLVCLLLISLFAGCGKTEPSAPTQNGPADAPNQAGSPAVTPAEDDDFSIKLKWVSFRPATHVSVIAIQETFVKRIYEATEGRVEIEYLGGTEIIAAADLGLAIKNGTFDFADLYVGAYDSVVPGAGCLSLSQLSPEEERSSGAYDVIDALHQENGIKYLGRPEGQPVAESKMILRRERLFLPPCDSPKRGHFVPLKPALPRSAKSRMSERM